MTVFENIAFGLRVRPRAPPDERVAESGSGSQRPARAGADARGGWASSGTRQASRRVAAAGGAGPGACGRAQGSPARRAVRRCSAQVREEAPRVAPPSPGRGARDHRLRDPRPGGGAGLRPGGGDERRPDRAGRHARRRVHRASEFVMDFLGDVVNFSGRVSGGRVRFANADVTRRTACPRSEETEGATVLVRPHDLEISREVRGPETEGHGGAILGGPTARLELRTRQREDLVAHIAGAARRAHRQGLCRSS